MRFLLRRKITSRPVREQSLATAQPASSDLPTQLTRLRRMLDRLDFGRVSYDELADAATRPGRPLTPERLELLHKGDPADVTAEELEQVAALYARDPHAFLNDTAVAEWVDAQMALLAAQAIFKRRLGAELAHMRPAPDLSSPEGVRAYAATLHRLAEILPDALAERDETL